MDNVQDISRVDELVTALLLCLGSREEDPIDKCYIRNAATIQGAPGVLIETRLPSVHRQHPRKAKGTGKSEGDPTSHEAVLAGVLSIRLRCGPWFFHIYPVKRLVLCSTTISYFLITLLH